MALHLLGRIAQRFQGPSRDQRLAARGVDAGHQRLELFGQPQRLGLGQQGAVAEPAIGLVGLQLRLGIGQERLPLLLNLARTGGDGGISGLGRLGCFVQRLGRFDPQHVISCIQIVGRLPLLVLQLGGLLDLLVERADGAGMLLGTELAALVGGLGGDLLLLEQLHIQL
ncbi:hypothetical protein D3C86_1131420 [compost metagenome]